MNDSSKSFASTGTFSNCSDFQTEDDKQANNHDVFLKNKTFLNIPTENLSNSLSIDHEDTETKNEFEAADYNSYSRIKMEDLAQLKDSTKRLLLLVDEIKSKMHSKNYKEFIKITNEKLPIISESNFLENTAHNFPSVSDVIGQRAINKLEFQTKTMDYICIEDEYDDCSVYKRLTRKCICLNRKEYNDFIIHFNEQSKYFTSIVGEIIKNLRIIKKFLYMGGDYTKNALLFLTDGLGHTLRSEKAEIVLGCSHADICNVFEDHSLVTVCISWPCKYDVYGDSKTQLLAAELLHKIAQVEEGRRYLNFSTKITNDIKKCLRKKASMLDFDTLEALNATVNLLHPPMTPNEDVTYYCKPIYEGMSNNTLNALMQYRVYMTMDEIFTHLDLLNKMSKKDFGKMELTTKLPMILSLFTKMLMEYDNSEMNIIVTNLLNNIVSKNMVKLEKDKGVENRDTEPKVKVMKSANIQFPPPQKKSKYNKSKSRLAIATPQKRKKVYDWESPKLMSKSKKFSKPIDNIIIVPVEQKIKIQE